MGKKGRLSKKNSTLAKNNYVEAKVPRSFVIHQGLASSNLRCLIHDFKKVMKPNTAAKLQAKKRNSLRDFVSMAGPLKITHIVIFSQSEVGINLKIARFPQGPTLSFSVENYSLVKDIISSSTKQVTEQKHALYAPCLMTNLQPSEGEKRLQLCSKMFLDIFPTISPSHIKQSQIKRCCLLHYDQDIDTFDFRHYAVKVRPVGLTKATRKVISTKIPNLSSYREVSDFVVKSEVLSESEFDEETTNHINIDKVRKGKSFKQKSMIKLSEIGPRLSLKLVKIEAGLRSGAILYHKYVTKTAQEKLKALKKREEEKRLKRLRQKEQQKNVKLKEEKKQSHRQRCLEGMGIDAAQLKQNENEKEEDDDGNEYYKEVGVKPPKDLFTKKERSRKKFKTNKEA